MILGHAHPEVIDSINQVSLNGTSYGIPTEMEIKIAELAVSLVPNIDNIRFVNSGTEACMSAVRLARGFTKKDKIIKFIGCYHGHADCFLIDAGSGALTFGVPNSPGVTNGTAQDTLTVPYNNIEAVKDLFNQNANEIAAVIIEPVAGNMGCILPKNGFLNELKALCVANNSLLIFDEVMTGFRLGLGGAQEAMKVDADIVTFGKVIGGGLPVGAFAARKEIMDFLSPNGPVYQAGTLSGNPLAMMAGYTTLSILKRDPSIYESLAKKTEYLHNGYIEVLNKKGIPNVINRYGSMISLHFTDVEVEDFETSSIGDNDLFKKYFHGMLKRGIYLPPSAYESYFLNDAISYDDLDYTIEAFESFIQNDL